MMKSWSIKEGNMKTIINILKFAVLSYLALILACLGVVTRRGIVGKGGGVLGIAMLVGIPCFVGYNFITSLFIPSSQPLPLTTSESIATTLATPAANLSNGERVSATLISVVNGDSLVVTVNGVTESVRLLGMDAPESGACFYGESAHRVDELLENTAIILEADPTQTNRDKFGRLWRYVWLANGRMVNEVLVEEGYAFEYTYFTPYEYQSEFQSAEAQAHTAGIGVWSETGCNGAGERPDREFTSIYLQMPENTTRAAVVRDVDGDTFEVEIEGQREYVRFIGIDTPERSNCYYTEASGRTSTLTHGETVWLEADNSQADRDSYNRLLRYVWLSDGQLLNALLVQEGYAYEYTYRTPYIYQAQFMQLEHEAQRSGLGLWSPQTCDGQAGRRYSNAYNDN
jgi:endonuclease YncB( thermonuclease family)